MFRLPEWYKGIRMEMEYCSCYQRNLRNAHFVLLPYFKHIVLFNKKQLDRTQLSQLRNVFCNFVLLYVFILLFPWCNACYVFRIKTTFGLSQLPFLCRRYHDLLCCLCLFARSGVQHVVTLWVTCRVSCKKQGMHTLSEHLGPSSIFWWFRVAQLFSFLCVVFVFVFCLCLSIDSNVAHVSQLTILDVPIDFL